MGKLAETQKFHIINECRSTLHSHANSEFTYRKLDRQISKESENSLKENSRRNEKAAANENENSVPTITDQSINSKIHIWRKTKKLSSVAAARINCTKSSIKLNKKRLYKLDRNCRTEQIDNDLSLPSSSGVPVIISQKNNSKKLIEKNQIKHEKRKLKILRLNGSNRKFWPFLKTVRYKFNLNFYST